MLILLVSCELCIVLFNKATYDVNNPNFTYLYIPKGNVVNKFEIKKKCLAIMNQLSFKTLGQFDNYYLKKNIDALIR